MELPNKLSEISEDEWVAIKSVIRQVQADQGGIHHFSGRFHRAKEILLKFGALKCLSGNRYAISIDSLYNYK